jgi:hypothetical protein
MEVVQTDMTEYSYTPQASTSRAVHEEIYTLSPPKRVKTKRSYVNMPKINNNPILKVEDIFPNELAGIFEGPSDMLDVHDNDKNPDGTLTETAELGLLGWDHYEWKCIVCSNEVEKVLLDSCQSLEQHFKTDHKDVKMTYPCMDCKLSFRSYFSFQNHVIEHQPHLKFSCDVCSIYRWNLIDLYKHRQEKHPKYKNTCLYCGRIFECGFFLKQHVGVHQKWKEDEHFYCDLCNYQTHTKFLIKQHITYSHGRAHYKELVCEQCGKVCKRVSDMVSCCWFVDEFFSLNC